MPQPKRSIERDGSKLCLACGQWQPMSEFYRKDATRLRSHCRTCLANEQRTRRGTPKPKPTLIERIRARTTETPDGCWLWTGTRNRDGYGLIQAGLVSRAGNPRQSKVHVVAYTELVGPVPDGKELDHLCRTKACWRPEHLEPVTHGENSRRARQYEIATFGMPKGGRGRPFRQPIPEVGFAGCEVGMVIPVTEEAA